MEHRRHKRNRKNHVIIMTSDVADAEVKQIRIRPWLLQALVIAGCVVIGAVLGYFFNEGQIRKFVNRKTEAQQVVIDSLEADKASLMEEIGQKESENESLQGQIGQLEQEIENLNSQIAVLSETVNQKTESENALLAAMEEDKVPTEYPLTGSASIDPATNQEICVFTASSGSTVVATASGTVTAVNDDSEYGHNVWIDHGNGYITIYRNQGDAIVRLGDVVSHGTTLFLIDSKNTKFGYQIMKDGVYIDPMEMLPISG